MTTRFPIARQIPVAWGDMDALGHVNNTVYLRWFESARIASFDEVAVDFEDVGVILAHQRCDYLAPVAYPDIVEARTGVIRIGGKSFTMAFEIRSAKSGEVAARGEGVLVAFDYRTQSPVEIPPAIRAAITSLEDPE